MLRHLIAQVAGTGPVDLVHAHGTGTIANDPVELSAIDQMMRGSPNVFSHKAALGHSLGANVAIEMAAAGKFSGPLVLLSPSFSRKDESKFPRALDHLGRVLGHLPYAAMFKVIGPAMKSSLPANRRDELVAELKKNDPRFVRRQTRRYLDYLDRYGSLVPRLCDSGVTARVVFGEHDDVRLADKERRKLDECPRTTVITISGAGHFTMNQEPRRVAELILEVIPADSGR